MAELKQYIHHNGKGNQLKEWGFEELSNNPADPISLGREWYDVQGQNRRVRMNDGNRQYTFRCFKPYELKIPANGSIDLPAFIGPRNILDVYIEDPYAGTVELNRTGTIDTTNVSTLDDNLINNDETDLCYNNSSQGSSNKPLPAIDLGSPQSVDSISLFWWPTTQAYNPSNYSIQASNNGTSFTDIVTGLDATGINGEQSISVSGTYRFWRMFCVSGNNATWVVLSEMRAYQASSSSSFINIFSTNLTLHLDQNTDIIKIVNNNTTAYNSLIYFLL